MSVPGCRTCRVFARVKRPAGKKSFRKNVGGRSAGARGWAVQVRCWGLTGDTGSATLWPLYLNEEAQAVVWWCWLMWDGARSWCGVVGVQSSEATAWVSVGSTEGESW